MEAEADRPATGAEHQPQEVEHQDERERQVAEGGDRLPPRRGVDDVAAGGQRHGEGQPGTPQTGVEQRLAVGRHRAHLDQPTDPGDEGAVAEEGDTIPDGEDVVAEHDVVELGQRGTDPDRHTAEGEEAPTPAAPEAPEPASVVPKLTSNTPMRPLFTGVWSAGRCCSVQVTQG